MACEVHDACDALHALCLRDFPSRAPSFSFLLFSWPRFVCCKVYTGIKTLTSDDEDEEHVEREREM